MIDFSKSAATALRDLNDSSSSSIKQNDMESSCDELQNDKLLRVRWSEVIGNSNLVDPERQPYEWPDVPFETTLE